MQTFPNPLMAAIESGTARAAALPLTCVSRYSNEQSVYWLQKPNGSQGLVLLNCRPAAANRRSGDRFCPQPFIDTHVHVLAHEWHRQHHF